MTGLNPDGLGANRRINNTITNSAKFVKNPYSSRNHGANRGFVVDNFQDLTNWTATTGSISADNTIQYGNGQTARIESDGTEGGVTIENTSFTSLDLTIGGKDPDISIALRADITTWSQNERPFVIDIFDSGANQTRYIQQVDRDQSDTWQRIDFQIEQDDADLTDVSTIEIFNTEANTSDITAFNIANLRAQPRGDHGYVIFSFDDAWDDHYDEAYSYMSPRGIPGVCAVPSSYVGDTGRLSISEMEEMASKSDGTPAWEMVNHWIDNSQAVDESLTEEEIETQIVTCKEFLISNGFQIGSQYMVYPGGQFNDDVLSLANEYSRLAFTYITDNGNTSVGQTDPLTISRWNASTSDVSLTSVKNNLDFAASNNQVAIMSFHKIGQSGSLNTSVSDFQEIVDYVAGRNDLIPITFSELDALQSSTI